MLTSKLTSKGQTTLPREIRERLDLHGGDYIAYWNSESGISLRKVKPFDAEWHAGVAKTLETEWNSREDDEDFGDL
jgi:antitoxin PrlF